MHQPDVYAPLGRPCQLFLPPQLARIIQSKLLTPNVQHMVAHLVMACSILGHIHCTFNIIMKRHFLSISIQADVTWDTVIVNSSLCKADRLKGTWTPLLMVVVATCIMERFKVSTSTPIRITTEDLFLVEIISSEWSTVQAQPHIRRVVRFLKIWW